MEGDIEDIVANWQKNGHDSSIHSFNPVEVQQIQKSLLEWYDLHARDLPWRFSLNEIEKEEHQRKKQKKEDDEFSIDFSDPSIRGYAVWVSEVMLQQTQVGTVIEYYKRWMKKFPTVYDLAKADIEDVNRIWSGLGYYSRARRLLEGAKIVVEKFNGILPSNPEIMQKEITGIGKYTAGAISSIAFGIKAPLVDGNVIRVLSRLRIVSGNPKAKLTNSLLWNLSSSLVPSDRPGDFNQALMELGSEVCNPTSPLCISCPISSNCLALIQQKVTQKQSSISCKNIEKECNICKESEKYDGIIEVTKYPVKVPKKAPKNEAFIVTILERQSSGLSELLLVQRPNTGLLAGLWEFPSVLIQSPNDDNDDESESKEDEKEKIEKRDESAIDKYLESLGLNFSKDEKFQRESLGTKTHIFSHLRHTYHVEYIFIDNQQWKPTNQLTSIRWIEKSTISQESISKGVNKALELLEKFQSKKPKSKPKPKNSKNLKKKK